MYKVIENKNETVDLFEGSNLKKTFHPNFDLPTALLLLKQFNEVEDEQGQKIYTLWDYQGYFLYPAIQERLFWGFFFQLVKHQEAWQAVRGKKIEFETHPYWCQRGLFTALQFIHHEPSLLQRALYNGLAYFFRLSYKKLNPVLIFDDGEHGFRYAKIKQAIGKYTSFSRIEKLNKGNLRTFFHKKNVLVAGKRSLFRTDPPRFNYERYPFLHPYLTKEEFQLLILSIHRQCLDIAADCKAMEKLFSKSPPKAILGYDQFEDALGIMVAAKRLKIPIYLFQHGLFTPYHAGWLCPSIPSEYCNVSPDKLSVWGPYWQDKLLTFSNRYTAKNIVIGAHHNRKITYDIKGSGPQTVRNSPLTVLFPFEFLTDNLAVSNYIRLFLKQGWKVIVKIRPKGMGDQDHLVYDDDIQSSILFVENLTDEEMDQIDVVACTQTTFAYDMMQYQKPIWYLKTSFAFLQQIVDDGIAYLLDEETLKTINTSGSLDSFLKPKYSLEMFKSLYSDEPLQQNIFHVLKTLKVVET